MKINLFSLFIKMLNLLNANCLKPRLYGAMKVRSIVIMNICIWIGYVCLVRIQKTSKRLNRSPSHFFVAIPHDSFQKRVMIFWKKMALTTFNNSIILTEVLRNLLNCTKKKGDSNEILKLKIVTGKEVPIEPSNHRE